MKKACQHLDLKAFVLDLLFVDDQVSWTTAYISRDPDSKELQTHLESHALQGVSPVHLFHSRTVDVLSLKRVKKLTPSTFEAQIEATTEFDDGETNVIAKVARFEWEIPRFERETAAYKLLSHRDATSRLVPRFLAHVAEHGREDGGNGGKVQMIDIEHSEIVSVREHGVEETMEAGMATLATELVDDSGRGGGFQPVD